MLALKLHSCVLGKRNYVLDRSLLGTEKWIEVKLVTRKFCDWNILGWQVVVSQVSKFKASRKNFLEGEIRFWDVKSLTLKVLNSNCDNLENLI